MTPEDVWAYRQALGPPTYAAWAEAGREHGSPWAMPRYAWALPWRWWRLYLHAGDFVLFWLWWHVGGAIDRLAAAGGILEELDADAAPEILENPVDVDLIGGLP